MYIKVWDGMNGWGKPDGRGRYGDPHDLREVKTLEEVFFHGYDVEVILWEEGDPVQGSGYGCGPFAFLVLCHRAQGVLPSRWTEADEGVARSYMWGCILQGSILPLPKNKLVETEVFHV